MLFDVSSTNSNILHFESEVQTDTITEQISKSFDYAFSGRVYTDIKIPKFPTNFQIGLIVGSSGSGKSSLLRQFGDIDEVEWDRTKSIASHFGSFESASAKFGAVGLNSIPTWLKPYHVLSTGEKFRADMARKLHDNAVVDEFTSVVNRECAISCSNSIAKYIRTNDIKNVVFASCHDDIIEYLQPDWIYNTDSQELSVGRCLRRTQITFTVHQCSYQIWSMFKKHHYLSGEINKASDCYLVCLNNLPVAFCSMLPMPGRFGDGSDPRVAYSFHRIVVLPDYQGLGIGVAVCEYIAELYHQNGYRVFLKTANPRLGEHNNKSSMWRPTCYNMRTKTKRDSVETITESDISSMMGGSARMETGGKGRCATVESAILALTRWCYSHEYIGDGSVILKETNVNTKRKRLF